MQISFYCRYFALAIRYETAPECRKWFLKIFIKLFLKKIWKFEKLALPLQSLSLRNEGNRFSEKSLKFFFKKIWKFGKVALPLQPLSASKIGKRDRNIDRLRSWDTNSFFEVFEQLNKFFPHSQECNFKRTITFEIRAKI